IPASLSLARAGMIISKELRGHEAMINCMTALKDGTLISASKDNIMRIWNPLTEKCLHTIIKVENVRFLTTFSDGLILSSGSGCYENWNPKDWDYLFAKKYEKEMFSSPLSNGLVPIATVDGIRFINSYLDITEKMIKIPYNIKSLSTLDN